MQSDQEKTAYTDCDQEHVGCINNPNGKCDIEKGHGGSHHCHSCNQTY